ncbi:hypothetical protein HDR59_05085 [bacterium]|nr:hypothetical protein [bacterium]
MKTIPIQSIKELPNNELLLNDEKIKYNFKFYRHEGYNHKTNDCVYYGDGFYTRRNYIIKPTGIIMDHFILTITKNNEFYNIKNLEKNYPDAFPDHLYKELLHKKITIVENDDGSKSINADGKQVIKLRNSTIEELTLLNPKYIDDYFLIFNLHLKKLNLPNVKRFGNNSLYYNEDLEEFNLPKVERICYDVLFNNKKLRALNLPNATSIMNILRHNKVLEKIYAPKLEKCADDIEYLYKVNPEIAGYIKKTIKENLAKKEILQEQHSR